MTLNPLRTFHWLSEKGFFSLLSANFLTQFLGFGTSLFVAKFLTPVELGEIRILQTYTGLFAVLAGFGLNTAILKFCAENRDEENKGFLLRFALTRSLITTLIALLVLVILAWLGVMTTSPHLTLWLMIFALTIPSVVVTGLLMVYLQALKKINEMARVQAFIRLQSFVVIVLCTWQWGFPGFVFATIVAYLVGLFPLIRQVGWRFLNTRNASVPTGFLDAALFSFLGMGVTALGQYGDIFILDHFSSDRVAIGYYALALTFTYAAMQVTSTVQSIVTPYFSEQSQNEAWVHHQIKRNQVRMVALSLVVAGSIYSLAWMLVQIFYGPTYNPSLDYLAILLIKYIVWSAYAVTGAALVGLGLIRYGFFLTLIYTPIGLLLTYVLLQLFGVVGVAWAQVGTALITFFLIAVTYRLELRKFFTSLSTNKTMLNVSVEVET